MTDQMREIIVKGLTDCWNYIAEDMYVNDMGEIDESVTYTRSDVFSIAADRFLGSQRTDSDVWEAWTNMTEEEREDLMKFTFPYEIYGY